MSRVSPIGTMHAQNETSSELKMGTLVWARMTTYPYWPAMIISQRQLEPEKLQPAGKKKNLLPKVKGKKKGYIVLFFGTTDYAWIEETKMFKFDQKTLGDFNLRKIKPSLRASLNTAVQAIECYKYEIRNVYQCELYRQCASEEMRSNIRQNCLVDCSTIVKEKKKSAAGKKDKDPAAVRKENIPATRAVKKEKEETSPEAYPEQVFPENSPEAAEGEKEICHSSIEYKNKISPAAAAAEDEKEEINLEMLSSGIKKEATENTEEFPFLTIQTVQSCSGQIFGHNYFLNQPDSPGPSRPEEEPPLRRNSGDSSTRKRPSPQKKGKVRLGGRKIFHRFGPVDQEPLSFGTLIAAKLKKLPLQRRAKIQMLLISVFLLSSRAQNKIFKDMQRLIYKM